MNFPGKGPIRIKQTLEEYAFGILLFRECVTHCVNVSGNIPPPLRFSALLLGNRSLLVFLPPPGPCSLGVPLGWLFPEAESISTLKRQSFIEK